MSDAPTPSPPPAEQASDNDEPGGGVDFTAILPLEVMVHLLEVGTLSYQQLAALRQVNRALCDAASDPSLYPDLSCGSVAVVEALPPFVANGLRRLSLSGFGEMDFGSFSERMPNLTLLAAPGHHVENGDGAKLALCELSMDAAVDAKQERGAAFLIQLTDLECLEVARLGHTAPIASLPRLRRLRLRACRASIGGMMTALASAPCAGTLEALHLELPSNANLAPGWWAPLADLTSLREFSVAGSIFNCRSPEDADAFADVLADHPTLAVLHVNVSHILGEAVLRRGLSSNLRVLGITSSDDDVEGAISGLPPDLVALRLSTGGNRSAADVRALLSRCPELRALDLGCDGEAVAYLASGSLADRRPLLLDLSLFNREASNALTAAGHRVGGLHFGVDWRVGGGLFFDGEAVAA